MPTLVPVQYGRLRYPEHVKPRLTEIAGHFDKKALPDVLGPYSLHTEYSFVARDLDAPILAEYPTLRASQRQSVPLLWSSDDWAVQFADYLVALVGNHQAPQVIEVHPPFVESCPSLAVFLERYQRFIERAKRSFPETSIVIENRAGTQLRRGRFLLDTAESLSELADRTAINGVDLGIVLDVPQLLTAHRVLPKTVTPDVVRRLIINLIDYRQSIRGLHLWGRNRQGSHHGDLTDLVAGRGEIKQAMLQALAELCGDEVPRYLVPEINDGRSRNLESMVEDLEGHGFVWG